MAKFVPDVKTRRWVVISQQRMMRPDGQNKKRKSCSFCPGNEQMTPKEVWRLGNGEENTPGWKVRVIPNKYPITDIHEVIIHSPDCHKDIENLPVEQVKLVLLAYRERFLAHRKDGQVMIYGNHGELAGASQNHPHSQLVVVPFQINLDTLEREPLNNLVNENTYFTVYCPDFSQWPYEVWIIPKKEKTTFGQINDEEIANLAQILKDSLKRLGRIYEKMLGVSNKENDFFAYNYYIYHGENWYLRIIPRLINRAGFELGTGLSVNIVDPVIAAEEMKG